MGDDALVVDQNARTLTVPEVVFLPAIERTCHALLPLPKICARTQIFKRARQRIAAGGQVRDSAPPPARRAEGEQLARRFFDAAAGGDIDALLAMLAPDVVFHGDGGGKAQAIGRSLTDPQHVGRVLVGGLRRMRMLGASLRPAWVNGRPGAVTYDAEGRVFSVVELDIADGVVQAIHAVSNPDKLGHLGPVSDIVLLPEK